jgi:hypothetical protein
MLQGTAPLPELLAHAATLAAFDTAPESFPDAVVFQAMFEISVAGRQRSLPAGLHPTNPPTIVIQAWRCPTSPWGAFSLAQVRVGCRHGLRPRGMVQACIVDNPVAAEALRSRWGFPAREGSVRLDVAYHDVTLHAALDGSPPLAVHATNPDPLGGDDVSFATTVVLAHTPRGERLVQVDTDLAVTRAERLHLAPLAPGAATVLAAAGVHTSVVPQHAVGASVSHGELTLQALRFVSRPDELAFTGTEKV